MKKFVFGSPILSLAFIGFATPEPPPVNLTTSGGSDVTAVPKSDVGDLGNSSVLTWLTSDITTYNSINSTKYSAPVEVPSEESVEVEESPNSYNLTVTGYSYLVLHWGGPGGGDVQAFYVGNYTGSYTFSTPDQGLSFYSLYTATPTSVPDGGSTGLMLGTALAGMGLVFLQFKQQARA